MKQASKDKLISAILAILMTAAICLIFSAISVFELQTYRAGVFFISPMVCGAISVILYNRKQWRSFASSMSVALISCLFALTVFLLTGFEGMICLIMALPVFLPMFLIGGVLGYLMHRVIGKPQRVNTAVILMVVLTPLMLGIESKIPASKSIREVKTAVVIDGQVDDVWQEVIAFSTIPEPEELIFKMGIAYPIDAKIEGQGVGAIRYCNFSTGSFVEPITIWRENDLLAFDVTAQPLPMTEMSPYVHIHPPHLDWAFISHKGQFKLNQLENGKIQLVGTTWFHTEIGPEFYWGRLCEELIHIIHLRVLNHIKHSVETKQSD